MATIQKEYFYFKSELNTQENEFFQHLKDKLDFQNVQIFRTISIVSPFLAKTLSDVRKIILAQHLADKNAFQQRNQTHDEDFDSRIQVLAHLEHKIKQWDWNLTDRFSLVPVLPAVHATELMSAWKIVNSGFAIVGSFDKGFYGKGIYLSTSAQYVRQYLYLKNRPTILICFVVLGKCYPVIESHTGPYSLEAKPITDGYHSHYVVTSSDGKVANMSTNDEVYDEIILGQELTALPLFLLMIKKSGIMENIITDECENINEPSLL